MYLLKSPSENTNSKYFSAFKRWERFITLEKGKAVPATPIHVALYLTYLLDNGSSCSVMIYLFIIYPLVAYTPLLCYFQTVCTAKCISVFIVIVCQIWVNLRHIFFRVSKYSGKILSESNCNVLAVLIASQSSKNIPGYICIGECPSNSPFLKDNGAEAHCF